MINCIILDDEPLAINIIKEFINKTPYLNLLKTFTNSLEASEYLKTTSVDLVFLDIEMPQISGIDFCKKYCENSMVIFTTAFSNYALLGYELNIIDYLLKPIELNRFLNACEKASQQFNFINLIKNNAEPNLIIKSFIVSKDMIDSLNKNYIKIDERDIPVGKTFKKNILLSN